MVVDSSIRVTHLNSTLYVFLYVIKDCVSLDKTNSRPLPGIGRVFHRRAVRFESGSGSPSRPRWNHSSSVSPPEMSVGAILIVRFSRRIECSRLKREW